MKLTTGIWAAAMMAGAAWAQNPNIINNVQNQMTAVQQKQTADSNAALGIQATPGSTQSSKPSAGAPAPAVKPAVIPGSKPAAAVTSAGSAPAPSANPQAAKPAAVTASTSSSSNKLEKVNVVRHGDDIEIEIGTREQVSADVSKLASPDRLLVELPATAVATEHSKIAIASAGVKGVRIGMNGKNPPTTSVVVDLEHAVPYDLSPGPSNQFVLTLHTQGAAQAAAKQLPPAPKQTVAKAAAVLAPATAQPAPTATAKRLAVPGSAPRAKTSSVAASAPAAKTVAAPAAAKVATRANAFAPKAAPKAAAAAKVTIAAANPPAKPASAGPQNSAGDDTLAPIGDTADAAKAPKPDDKKWAMTGKHDPFVSPVTQQQSGSGCATGKKCLEIGQINVRGIVKSQDGFIAVVTNSMNKAYFLHENDPVFNGFVMRITGDSVVFQETYQDKLGKPLTREVTKYVTTPAV
jgi:AMIN domain